MKKYLSHLSAALQWNIPRLDQVFGKENVDKRRNKQIIDFTVDEPGKRCKRTEYIYHSCKYPLPRGAVVKRGGHFIAAPELLFLEFANELDIQKLILLGLQMCSHFPGKASEAITTKLKLKGFLQKSPGFYGHAKAERALKHIENSSNSIMESLLFMALTLPYKLGGYGFSGPSLNHEILLDHKGARQLKQKKCYVDIYYEEFKLAIEYDSFEHHSTPDEQGKDSLRASVLRSQGLDVIQLYTTNLYNKTAFENVAADLSSRLNKRIRIRSSKFQSAHRNLRKLLPTNSREP